MSETKTEVVELFGGDYEHVLELARAEGGIDIRYNKRPLLEIFEGMLAEQRYEACEFSLSNYIMLKDRGAEFLWAVPVFPYRAFRHSTLFVHKDSPLNEPKQLKGRRVGVPDYSMTAAVWTRGILDEQYGVHWSDLGWAVSGRQRFAVLEGIAMEAVDTDLEEALVRGEIDALLTPHTRDEVKPEHERQLRPLIADAQAAEEEYLKLTGIYPINHVIVVRDDTLRRLSNVGPALFRAYADAKAAAYKRRLGTTLMPWGQRHWTRVFDQFGGDPLPYGLSEPNRKNVAKLAGYLHDQKLVGAVPDIDALFLPGSAKLRE